MSSVRLKPNEFYEYKTMSGVLPGRKVAALRLKFQYRQVVRKGRRPSQRQAAGGGRRQVRRTRHAFQHRDRRALGDFPRRLRAEVARRGRQRAIAARYLARPDAKAMALLGAGWQASAHLVTLSMIRDLKQIKIFSPTPDSRRRFIAEWSGKVAAQLIEAESAAQAIDGVDMVIATTNSISPLFPAIFYGRGCMFPVSSLASSTRRRTSAPIR